MSVEEKNTNFRFNNYTCHGTGTTTASYVSALNWNTKGLKKKSIHLVNTHESATLKYKLLATYSDDQTSGKEDTLVSETTLAAGADARMQYSNEYCKLIIQVVDGSGHATYEINCIGQGA